MYSGYCDVFVICVLRIKLFTRSSLFRRGSRAFRMGEFTEKSECRRKMPWKAGPPISLQNRREFFAFFRRESRTEKLKNAKNHACSAGYRLLTLSACVPALTSISGYTSHPIGPLQRREGVKNEDHQHLNIASRSRYLGNCRKLIIRDFVCCSPVLLARIYVCSRCKHL